MIELTDKHKHMQYKVPQDVQREDTIVGPLTLKQLIIVAVGGGISYALYVQLSAIYFAQIWLPPVLIVSAFTLAVAFLKVHDLLFYEFLMHFIEYHVLPKRRFWIQGTGDSFVPPYQPAKTIKKEKSGEKKEKSRNLAELGKLLDSGGQS